MRPPACLLFTCLLSISSFAAAEEGPKTTLAKPVAEIVETSFSDPAALAVKGKAKPAGAPLWRGGIGQWEIRDGSLHGDELEADHHHASCTYEAEFKDVILTAQFRLGAAQQVAFGFRDNIAPHHHLARVFITPQSVWVQRMSGIAKTTKAEKLKEMPLKTDPETWHDLTVEVVGDHYRATIDGQVIEAKHERFQDTKGITALIVKGQGAQFRNVRLWKAAPKE